MPTTPADVIHVAHLIVTTIPVTADDSSGLAMVDFATPISRTYRLAESAPTHLIDINGDPIHYPTVADIDADVEALADWEQTTLDTQAATSNLEPASAVYEPGHPAYAPEPTPKATNSKKPTTKSKQRQRGGRKSKAETERLNTTIRDHLAAGATVKEIADLVGLSTTSINRRIKNHQLDPHADPDTPEPTAPKAAPKPAPRSRPAPPAPVKGAGVALGAKRRLQSLTAIGYTTTALNIRLKDRGCEFTVDEVLALPDGSEIPLVAFDVINDLWHRLRYLPVSGPSANYPPPGAWTNIDDPNEHHQVKE